MRVFSIQDICEPLLEIDCISGSVCVTTIRPGEHPEEEAVFFL